VTLDELRELTRTMPGTAVIHVQVRGNLEFDGTLGELYEFREEMIENVLYSMGRIVVQLDEDQADTFDRQKDKATSTHPPQGEHMKKHVAKHKMNHEWSAAADEVKALIPSPAHKSGEVTAPHVDADIAGVQRMYDAIEDAGDDPDARLQAALKSFADNTNDLAAGIAEAKVPANEGAHLAELLIGHTMAHMKTIKASVLHGHKKD
jgi:hypothetical protein